MVLGFCCQRERSLYLVHIFILAGAGYYYFQKSVEKMVPDYGTAEKSAQRQKLKSEKKQVFRASPRPPTHKEAGGQNDTALQEETGASAQEEGQEKKTKEEVAVYPPEDSDQKILKEERSGSWGATLWRKFWLSWFPASDNPKMKNRD